MMPTAEALAVHDALHNPEVEYVRTSFDTVSDSLFAHRVHNANTPTQLFRSVAAGPYVLVTQNLRKSSPMTTWIKADPARRKITWIMQGEKYLARVMDYVGDTGCRVRELIELHPERTLYRHEAEGDKEESSDT
jgi:hypothetical protein